MPLRFIHLSDTHLDTGDPSDQPFKLHGVDTLDQTTRLIGYIKSLVSDGLPVDFVVHTGDLCNSEDENQNAGIQTALGARLLAELPSPLLILNGNHDRLEFIRKEFGDNRLDGELAAPLGTAESRSSILRHKNTLLVFLDARPRHSSVIKPDERGSADSRDFKHELDPAGHLRDDELIAFRSLLKESEEDILIFLHYPPMPLDCPWIDQSMLIDNGDELHALLRSVDSRVRGVFFGHVHESIQSLRDGIFYVAVGAASCGFETWPHAVSGANDTGIAPQAASGPRFNYVSMERGVLTIKNINVPLHIL